MAVNCWQCRVGTLSPRPVQRAGVRVCTSVGCVHRCMCTSAQVHVYRSAGLSGTQVDGASPQWVFPDAQGPWGPDGECSVEEDLRARVLGSFARNGASTEVWVPGSMRPGLLFCLLPSQQLGRGVLGPRSLFQSRCPLPGPSSVDGRPAEGEGPSHCCPSEASRGPGSPAARGLSPALLMPRVWHSLLRSAVQGGSCPRAFAQLPAEMAISLPRPPAPALRTVPLAFPEHVRLSR